MANRIIAAAAEEYADTRIGPNFGSSGTASSEKSTWPMRAPTASSRPSGRPPHNPLVSPAPMVTMTAAVTSRAVGRLRSIKGPMSAKTIGADPITVPIVAGLV
jgi:hypothetical protein